MSVERKSSETYSSKANRILGKADLGVLTLSDYHNLGPGEVDFTVYEIKIPRRYSLKSIGGIASFSVKNEGPVSIKFGSHFDEVGVLQRLAIVSAFKLYQMDYRAKEVDLKCDWSLSLPTQTLLKTLF